jgi:hypothetical protein
MLTGIYTQKVPIIFLRQIVIINKEFHYFTTFWFKENQGMYHVLSLFSIQDDYNTFKNVFQEK